MALVWTLTSTVFGLFLTGCALLQDSFLSEPKLTLQQIRITDISFSALKLNLVLQVQNRSAFTLTLSSLEYQFFAADNLVAHGSFAEHVEFPRNSEKNLEIPLSIVPKEVLKLLKLTLSRDQEEGIPTNLHVKGSFESLFGTMDFDSSYEKKMALPKLK